MFTAIAGALSALGGLYLLARKIINATKQGKILTGQIQDDTQRRMIESVEQRMDDIDAEAQRGRPGTIVVLRALYLQEMSDCDPKLIDAVLRLRSKRQTVAMTPRWENRWPQEF